MPGLYKSSGYNLERMELKFMWLDSQVELMNEEEAEKGEEDANTKKNPVLVEE